jgi:hypothetical protein
VCPLLTSDGRSPPSPRRFEGCGLLAAGSPPQEARCGPLLLGATYSLRPLRIPASRTSRSRQGGPTASSSLSVRLCRPRPLLLSFPYTTAWRTAAASLVVVAYPARRPPLLGLFTPYYTNRGGPIASSSSGSPLPPPFTGSAREEREAQWCVDFASAVGEEKFCIIVASTVCEANEGMPLLFCLALLESV